VTDIRKTIGQMLEDVASEHASRDALIHTENGIRYDYRDLSREIDRVSCAFINRGIKQGDKIAIWAPNIPEWFISMLGLAKIGAVAVPIDPAASRENLRYILEQSECSGLIVAARDDEDGALEMARAAGRDVPALEHLIVAGDFTAAGMVSWRDLIAGAGLVSQEMLGAAAAAVSPHDPVAIMYTSGTTGQP